MWQALFELPMLREIDPAFNLQASGMPDLWFAYSDVVHVVYVITL